MSEFDLQSVIERLTAKIAEDLRNPDAEETVANVTMRHAPVACTKLSFEPVNALEQVSLNALISWVSANCNLTEQQIAAKLATSFNAEKVSGISRADFDEAIAWLVDFKPVSN